MFKPIHVTCPAAMAKTCTLHIALDSKTEISPYAKGRYQFLLDGAAPMPGPTDEHGFYLFTLYVAGEYYPEEERQSYPATVVGKVTNSQSKDHKLEVSVACTDAAGLGLCAATAHWSTMRIDVFEP